MELKTALFQMDVQWHDPQANRLKAEEFIRQADADLVVLPEMFTTGFDINGVDMAEPADGETVAWMRKLSAETGKAITGSVIIKDRRVDGAEGTFNRLYFVTPDGVRQYDKRHLFSFSGEDKLFTAGSERIVIEYKGFRILPLICYDLRFPVWSRGSDEFDVMIYVASWPDRRVSSWDILLRARAVENQCYVLAVNRVGDDPAAHYNGHTQALDYLGQEIATAADDREEGIYATLDMDSLLQYRDKFRAWEDSDKFEIKK